jgi:hypothetical protein
VATLPIRGLGPPTALAVDETSIYIALTIPGGPPRPRCRSEDHSQIAALTSAAAGEFSSAATRR